MPGDRFTLEFYRSADGDEPVYRWLFSELDASKRRALVLALEYVLGEHGVGVCGTEFGRHLGQGLFEFRLRHDEVALRRRLRPPALSLDQSPARSSVLLRVFCHAYGSRIVLLLGGYDKGRDASRKRQRHEIDVARRRLADFQARRRADGPR